MYATAWLDAALHYKLQTTSPLCIGPSLRGQYQARTQREPAQKGRQLTHALSYKRGATSNRGGQAEVQMPHLVHGEHGPVAEIPATAIRGALRQCLRDRFDRAISAASGEIDGVWQLDQAGDGAEDFNGWSATDPEYWTGRFGDPLSRHLFGSEARRGATSFTAARAEPEDRPATRYGSDAAGSSRHAPRHHIRVLVQNSLDRITMASTEGLRTGAALDVGTEFKGRIELCNPGWWQIGAIGLALQLLSSGHTGLGSRRNAGLGSVEAEVTGLDLRWHPSFPPFDPKRLPAIGTLEAAWKSERQRGSFEEGGAERLMFYRDREDVLDCSDLALRLERPSTSDGPGCGIRGRLDGKDAIRAWQLATARLPPALACILGRDDA